MAGTRRTRSPEKDDPSKRRRTGEQASPTDETTPYEPPTTSSEESEDADVSEIFGIDPGVASYMAKWQQIAPGKTSATSFSGKSGDRKVSRSPSKSVRFAKGTGHTPEESEKGDQDRVNDQLARENGNSKRAGAHMGDDGTRTELTTNGGGSPANASGGTIDRLPRTRLPQADFKPHPVLPRTDDEFEEVLILIKRTAWRWAFQYFNDVSTNEARGLDLYKLTQQSPELMEYANWIALGGERWEDIFNEKRASLVFGILGKMLEIHVFGHEMFGATSGQLEALLAIEKEMVQVDGFARQQVRASMIRGLMATSVLPPNFNSQAQSITLSFYTMIRLLIPEPPTSYTAPTSPLARGEPFSPSRSPNLSTHISSATAKATTSRSLSFAATTPPPESPAEHADLLASLYQIICSAAKVSLNMRREAATIYHISSPAKNSTFAFETSPISSFTATSEEMHCMNLKHLRDAYAFVDDTASALVTMVCFPGIVAYRPGNGRQGGDDDGYRTRRICTAEVLVGWANRAPPVTRARGAQPREAGTAARNWRWGPGDWDVSLREAVEARRKAKGVSPLLVAAGIAAVAGFVQAQVSSMI
ncbi:hypothetical protein LPUS_09344 [Lasallia pustulata]|uniref:Uncharacterized protein n=1 Tax=Lasallia pustulata TaxID=136370 RepID=A0A1W5D730_9LECA|nr:hypothetical protein LPUS_09344 [Lasallia pustulata]